MKKKSVVIILSILVIILGLVIAYLFIFDSSKNNVKENKEPDKVDNNNEVKEEEETEEEKLEKMVNSKLESMTLDEKIGQMLVISNRVSAMTDSLRKELEEYKPGGFILFSENFTTYDQTLKLVNEIKETSDIPLFIAADEEGGNVQRLLSLKDKVTNIPNMFRVGEANDKDLAYEVGKVIAEELRVFGINMDFAPVLDIVDSKNQSFIGNRSFGTNPTLVTDMGLSVGKGLEDNLVIPVYKHFPGHGSTVADSHYDLPVINKTKSELMDRELIPFKEAIKNNADVIMIGHLAIPKLTNDKTPASLSKTLITDLLKDELNYNGLVITDALNMGAITKNYQEKEIYEMAINAGVDLLLMPNSSSSALKNIKESIAIGKISEEQINDSVKKILTLKYKKLENSNPLPKSYLGSTEHQEIISKIK